MTPPTRPDRSRPAGTERSRSEARAQSHVVGVALLIGLTMLSLGALTATIGTVVESNAAVGDVERVAADLDDAVEPVESTGTAVGTVAFADGTLRTEPRSVRVFRDGDVAVERETTALVYDRGRYGATSVAGAVVRSHAGSASLASAPPVSASRDAVVIGVAEVRADAFAIEGNRPVTATLTTEASHDRAVEDAAAEWGIAVETPTPAPWVRRFEERGATVRTERFPGDEHASVVATFPGERTGHVVVHRLDLEVRRG